MKTNSRKNNHDRVSMAIVMSFCLITLVAIFTVKANIDKINNNQSNMPVSEKTPVAQAEKPKSSTTGESAITTTEPSVSAAVPTVVSEDKTKSKTKEKSTELTFASPIKGKITVSKEYSMDSLTYSKTLDQFMVHQGIDILAEIGEPTMAIAEGTINKVYDDDSFGRTVVINHPNGYMSRYSNLKNNVSVEVGDTVSKGDVIGKVGKTAKVEQADESHLHLEIAKDGHLLNPADLINM